MGLVLVFVANKSIRLIFEHTRRKKMKPPCRWCVYIAWQYRILGRGFSRDLSRTVRINMKYIRMSNRQFAARHSLTHLVYRIIWCSLDLSPYEVEVQCHRSERENLVINEKLIGVQIDCTVIKWLGTKSVGGGCRRCKRYNISVGAILGGIVFPLWSLELRVEPYRREKDGRLSGVPYTVRNPNNSVRKMT